MQPGGAWEGRTRAVAVDVPGAPLLLAYLRF